MARLASGDAHSQVAPRRQHTRQRHVLPPVRRELPGPRRRRPIGAECSLEEKSTEIIKLTISSRELPVKVNPDRSGRVV